MRHYQLPACSADASASLTKKLAAAERILKLGELCRKLETEQEKVLPFCTPQQALGLDPLQELGSPNQQQQQSGPAASESSQTDSISFDENDQQVSFVCPLTSAADFGDSVGPVDGLLCHPV